MVSTPARSSARRAAASEKRATPMTLRSGAARFASRASVGPILPATPRIRISPGDARQIVDERRRRLGHEILERGDALEPLGKRAHPPAARARPTGSRGAAGIGRMEAKSSPAADGKARAIERADREAPLRDAQPRRAGALGIEIGMRGDEGRLLGLGRERHAVDEVVAVALDMGQPEERRRGRDPAAR